MIESVLHPEITEVDNPPTFKSRRALTRHLFKHVLQHVAGEPEDVRPTDQQWRHLLDSTAFVSAQREARTGQTRGPSINLLANQYETMVGQLVYDSCANGCDHIHTAKFGIGDNEDDAMPWKPIVKAIRVTTMSPSKRIWIVVEASVTNGSQPTYVIKTAYRPWPSLGGKSFMRKVREMLWRKLGKQTETLIADHRNWSGK